MGKQSGSTRRRLKSPTCHIPIVSEAMKVVGWTTQAPAVVGMELKHPEAEALVGSPLDAVYVELDHREDVIAAGAPLNWHGPWRCLALVNRKTAELMSFAGAKAVAIRATFHTN